MGRLPGQTAADLRHDMQDGILVGMVADSGIGISPEDQEHLFSEFFRTDEARASGEIGTGLGLSIVKQILEANGGGIECDSEPGMGTQFTFTLPVEPVASVDQDAGYG